MSKSISRPRPGVDRQSYERVIRFCRFCRRWVMAPFLGLFAIVSATILIATAIEKPEYWIAVSVPLGLLLMLVVALRMSAALKPVDPVFCERPPLTPWRLTDPRLSHWGVWRADLGRIPIETAAFDADHVEVKAYIQKLLEDWSQRSARGGSVVQISRPVSPMQSPFGDGPVGWKVYRITLDDGELRRTGWLRLGAGWAEFQLQRSPAERTTLIEVLQDVPPPEKEEPNRTALMRELLEEQVGPLQPVAARPDPFASHYHPMWDRWLDL